MQEKLRNSVCEHLNFLANVNVSRLVDDGGEVDSFLAEITVNCTVCGTPFHFRGVDCGLSKNRPLCDVGGTTLRAPIRPGELKALPTGLLYEVENNDSINIEGEN